jgi:UDP-glucose 4-epimerase
LRCLVLGANGFIGSHIVDLLKSKFSYVASFARSSYFYNGEVKSYIGDFKNNDALENALVGHDCVIHSISSSTPAIASADPKFDVEANLLPTIYLVQAMAKHNVRKLIYISSGGTVYGNPKSLPVNECDALNPISIYGATKVAVENYLIILCAQFDIELAIVRPSNPFGPRQYCKGAQGLIATLLDNAIKEKPIVLFDNGKAIRDYIYIDDFTQAIYQIIKLNAVGIYNISSNTGYSIETITCLVEKVTGYDFERILKPKREFDSNEIVVDSTKAKTDLNWSPVVPIETGIKKQFDSMVEV